MAPPKKRARTTRNNPDDQTQSAAAAAAAPTPASPSNLLSDVRTAWLVRGDNELAELRAGGESFKVAKAVLMAQSEYFQSCLGSQFIEGTKGQVEFDNEVDPKYLGLYIGLAYSHCSLVPHEPPPYASHPETCAPKTAMKDYVEVYKLCDRFISPKMGDFISKCIDTAIGDGHRALFRTHSDEKLQKTLLTDFADGFEALNLDHNTQRLIGERMIQYFVEGVDYNVWANSFQELMERPRFVAHVSAGFSKKLQELQNMRKSLKRKELTGPWRDGMNGFSAP